ncbi:MAG: hypothetical protein ACOYNS_03020 [Bacteroidota bacterium]
MMYNRSVRISAVLFLVSMMLSAQDVSITDFRIPESRFHTMQFMLNGELSANRQGGSPTWTSSMSRSNYQISAEHQLSYNSEERSYGFHMLLRGTSYGNENRYNQTTFLPNEQIQSYRSDGLMILYDGQYSPYISPDELYWYAASSGFGTYDFHHTSLEQDKVNQGIGFNKYQIFNINIRGGIGYGKMRDARSVIVVMRIIENLTQDGYLLRSLTREEIIELAAQYQTAVAVNSSHERPSKFIMKIIFDYLLEKGAVNNEKIVAYASERTAEVFHEQIYSRMFGWTIQAGLSVGHSEQRSTSQFPPVGFNKSDDRDIIIEGKYGYPISTLLHSFSSIVLLVPVEGRQNRVGYDVSTGLTYELSERISTDIGVSYFRTGSYISGNMYGGDRFEFGNVLSAEAGVNFFVEDFITLTVRGSYFDNLNRTERTSYATRSIYDSYDLTFGVNYRIF